MLFSEPKIPQFLVHRKKSVYLRRFSALQRAENSSIHIFYAIFNDLECFSALQRAENSSIYKKTTEFRIPNRFSALQRAENSSIVADFNYTDAFVLFQCSSASRKFLNRLALASLVAARQQFQCSSASRKFLNADCGGVGCKGTSSFSALQRAENSSMFWVNRRNNIKRSFSALQRAENSSISVRR